MACHIAPIKYITVNKVHVLVSCCILFMSIKVYTSIAVHSKQKQTSNKPFIPKHSILVSCVNDIGYSETRLG